MHSHNGLCTLTQYKHLSITTKTNNKELAELQGSRERQLCSVCLSTMTVAYPSKKKWVCCTRPRAQVSLVAFVSNKRLPTVCMVPLLSWRAVYSEMCYSRALFDKTL